jgi:DNA-binding transcriptional MocR family regulator
MVWTPRLRRDGPLYLALAGAIADDVLAGRLAPGDRLPPQRDLADALRVTVTTVTRAYAEAARRGLVTGEVGRGTFVRAPAFASSMPACSASPGPAGAAPHVGAAFGPGVRHRPRDPGTVDLSLNTLLPHAHARDITGRLAALAARGDADRLLNYPPYEGHREHRDAGAAWIEAAGLTCDPANVIVTAGAQHALSITLASLAAPGDVVLAEALTFPGMTALAGYLHLDVHAVAMDDHGLVPGALEAAVRRKGARLLYCMPSIQNPTAAVMPQARREQLADVATRLDLTLIEDDTYGFLAPGVRPVSALIPERSVYISSLSKSLAPGLRLGFLRAPAKWMDRLIGAMFATVVTATPLMAAVAAEMIADGTAARVLAWKRRETKARQLIARRALRRFTVRGERASPHLWLELPARWTADDLADELARQHVLVTPGRQFAVVRRDAPAAVRICLGTPPDRRTLERAIGVIASVLSASPRGLGRAI